MTVEPITISYTLNGVNLGIAYKFAKAELKGQALFPHVMTKNQNFTVNFGQLPAPMSNLLPGYSPIGQLDTTDGLVRGTRAPARREDCEALQLVGLPGAGKTYFANDHSRKHPEKKYNILGTNSLIDKMKVMGLTRQKNYSGRWDQLISKCTDCFNVLIKIASKRRRNYILDQVKYYFKN
jgi:heterogeneous nuclear ribonucleoprotein U-like protein 1